jgi:hypothetical protein
MMALPPASPLARRCPSDAGRGASALPGFAARAAARLRAPGPRKAAQAVLANAVS